MRAATTLAAAFLALAGCASAPRMAPAPAPDFYAGLDAASRAAAAQGFQTALERFGSNQSNFWSAGGGLGGSVTPLRTLRDDAGRYCRDYREMLVRPGQGSESREGRACRDPQRGLWLTAAR